MLGLAQQVGHDHLGIGGVVGDHQYLGRAGQQVDADAAVKLALGLGDIGISGPDQHVDGTDIAGPQRHGADRLDAAEDVDLVGPAQGHGGDGFGVRRAVGRRCARDDAFDAGDPGGDHRHVRRGDHGVTPARYIAADGVDRDVAMAEFDAGDGLDLDVGEGGALDLGELANLGLGEGDVGDGLVRHRGDEAVDLLGAKAKALGRPAVEFHRQRAHRIRTARFDVGEDRLDRLAHLGVGGLRLGLADAAFQMFGHRRLT